MHESATHQELGAALRRLRQRALMSQEALSEASGVSARTISDLERGRRQESRLETLSLLATALRLSDVDRRSLMTAARPDGATQRFPSLRLAPDVSLPHFANPLIGRDSAIVDLLALLDRGPGTIVTLTGPGGVAKTRLAIACARLAQCNYPDVVAFVGLASVSDPALVADALARAVGLAERGPDMVDRLVAVLAHRRLLLVVDNFEHLLDAAPLLAHLAEKCPGLTLLVTSRARLRLSREVELPLPALDLPVAGDPFESIRSSGAVQLLVERARASNVEFALDAHNAADISAICRRLDGLPLAIELAASRLRVLSVPALLQRLDNQLPLLTRGNRDLPARHHSMRATIAWSYDHLRPNERRFLRWMSVFVNGLTLEAATALGNQLGMATEESLDVLTALVESALVRRRDEGGHSRYQMFETIREDGIDRLESTGELTQA
jgi:predicted ATPase/transcriptional regulator with XRE-family HTH domain